MCRKKLLLFTPLQTGVYGHVCVVTQRMGLGVEGKGDNDKGERVMCECVKDLCIWQGTYIITKHLLL